VDGAVAVGVVAVSVGVVVVGTSVAAGAVAGSWATLEDWSFVSPHPSATGATTRRHDNITARRPTPRGDKEVLR
jgi:hypothetical protein